MLEYLGLRRAPGSEPEAADRVAGAVLMVGVVLVLFSTRHLQAWTQVLVMLAGSLAMGVIAGAAAILVRRYVSR